MHKSIKIFSYKNALIAVQVVATNLLVCYSIFMPNFPIIKGTPHYLEVSENNALAIEDLFQAVDKTRVLLCGGIIISTYLKEGEMAEPHELGVNDIDLLAPSIDDILKPEILEKFYVTHIHYYPKKEGDYHHNKLPHDNFFVGLEHIATKVKLHIFDYLPFDPLELNIFNFGELELLGRSAEDQAVTKLLEIIRLTGTSLYELPKGPIVSTKPIFELIALLSVCDSARVQYLWHIHPNRIGHAYGQGYYEALSGTLSFALTHSGVMAKTAPKPNATPQVVAGEEQHKCPECIVDYPGFSLHKSQ